MPKEILGESFSSLYIHFPFCESKCHYCDFFSLPEAQVEPGKRTSIYGSIAKELLFFSRWLESPLKTIFLGGGTPSLVPLAFMESLLGSLPLNVETELTMEANPSSVSLPQSTDWRSFGINRISMGVQALCNDRLKWLGRVHSKAEVYAALDALFTAGFMNVSTDYIVGVPGQTVAVIERELGELLTCFPAINHISAYLLTLKKSNARFGALPPEEEQLAHLRAVSQILERFGFEQYEISNFSRPGARAKHNENYWLGGGYLGIGPSAHAYWPQSRRRTKNWASLGKYVEMVQQGDCPIEWEEHLSEEQLRLEYLMLRLRRAEGLDLDEYKNLFKDDLYTRHQNSIQKWVEKKLCALTSDSRLKLTADGFFLSDQILSKIC